MAKQDLQANVVPSGVDERDIFIKKINEIIKLRETAHSAKEAEKDILQELYDKHKEINKNYSLKKGKFNKYTKSIVAEHLESKVSEIVNDSEESLVAYELVKTKLV